MLMHYGYCDGSGEYYIVIDTDKCDGCGDCVKICPQNALNLILEFIDLEDKTVVAVKDSHRKKIKYTCSSCKPEDNDAPCTQVCTKNAIKFIWKQN